MSSPAVTSADRLRGRILGTIAFLLAWIVGRTLRWTVVGEEHVRAARAEGGPLTWASWHGRQLLTIDFHSRKGKGGRAPGERMRVVVLASLSRDGEIQTAMLERFGYRVERGSSTRGAVRGLLTMGRAMREGWEPAIAVDGPIGPLHGVKQGIVALAKHEGAKIVPTMASASAGWIVPSWDRTFVPRPFARAVMIYAAPVEVPKDASDERLEEIRASVEATLRRLTVEADAFFGAKAAANVARIHAIADAKAEARRARKALRTASGKAER